MVGPKTREGNQGALQLAAPLQGQRAGQLPRLARDEVGRRWRRRRQHRSRHHGRLRQGGRRGRRLTQGRRPTDGALRQVPSGATVGWSREDTRRQPLDRALQPRGKIRRRERDAGTGGNEGGDRPPEGPQRGRSSPPFELKQMCRHAGPRKRRQLRLGVVGPADRAQEIPRQSCSRVRPTLLLSQSLSDHDVAPSASKNLFRAL
jgi:hypothetical protein